MRLLSGMRQDIFRRLIALSAILILLAIAPREMHSAGASQATTLSSDPLILSIHGDMWAWTGKDTPLQRRTSWGRNEAPIISPDGSKVAYLSWATVFVEWAKNKGGMSGFEIPMNVWVVDAFSDTSFRVGDQPISASYNGPNEPGNYLIRSSPTWSPDGTALAWSEYHSSQGTVQIVVYNLAQKASRVIVTRLPKNIRWQSPYDVLWGPPGIALVIPRPFEVDEHGYDKPSKLLLYTPTGKLLSRIEIDPTLAMDTIYETIWIQDGGRHYLGYWDRSDWMMLDIQNKQILPMPGVPALYSLTTPAGISVIPDKDSWRIVLPDNAKIALDENYTLLQMAYLRGPIGISRDGQRLAYLKARDSASNYKPFVYAVGQFSEIAPDSDGVAWGPTGWRIRREVAK